MSANAATRSVNAANPSARRRRRNCGDAASSTSSSLKPRDAPKLGEPVTDPGGAEADPLAANHANCPPGPPGRTDSWVAVTGNLNRVHQAGGRPAGSGTRRRLHLSCSAISVSEPGSAAAHKIAAAPTWSTARSRGPIRQRGPAEQPDQRRVRGGVVQQVEHRYTPPRRPRAGPRARRRVPRPAPGCPLCSTRSAAPESHAIPAQIAMSPAGTPARTCLGDPVAHSIPPTSSL